MSTTEVLRLARAGCTYPEISRRTGVPVRRAGEIARGAGISRKPRKNPAWWEFTATQRGRAVDMYIDGASMREIEAAVLASSTAVRGWLRKAGVKVRGTGRAGRFDGAEIRRLRSDGFSITQVMDIVECSAGTVWYHCKGQEGRDR